MSNSSLVTYTKFSPYGTEPRHGKILGISINTMAGPGSVEGCGQVFQTSEASSHYGIGPDGRIGQHFLEENRAWCCSHQVDHNMVTIEVSSIQAYQEPYECTEAACRALIDLCVDICRRNGIQRLLWKEGKQYVRPLPSTGPCVTWCPTDKGKSCPGNYLFSKYGEIAEEVNRRLAGGEEEEDVDITKMIADMADEQAYQLLAKAQRYVVALPEPDWSKEEGHWARTTSTGLMDGTAPERAMKRDEVIAVLGRLGVST